MATLYELSHDWRQVLDLMESGDVDAEVIQDTLEAMESSIQDKAESYCMVDLELKANIEKIDKEIKRLQDRKKTLVNNQKRLKETLMDNMLLAGMEKIKTDTFNIYIQKNPASVSVLDEKAIPSDYFVDQDPTLDKKRLLDDLKAGKEIKGVELNQTQGIRYR